MLLTLRTSDFDFDLPDELIAQTPPAERSSGRLLVLSEHGPQDSTVRELPQWLRSGDLLVMNDTRVYPARLHGHKDSGGKVELLIERIVDDRRALCLIRASKAPREGGLLQFASGSAEVLGRDADLFEVRFDIPQVLTDYLQEHGQLPLPPYIQRDADSADFERYQTVYAREVGAVAAPTAGLHFDQALLDQCEAAGLQRAYLTLHVGAGTFQPVRSDDLQDHVMHAERLRVDAALCEQIAETRAKGGRVIAVGTTVVRALESAAASGKLEPFEGDTRLFIKPGDTFNVVDGLLTNFHLPKSTLLMLVCAFSGQQRVLDGYRFAVENRYRFFSYGDAMLTFRHEDVN
jgi:S-adenosylmethionine:tRNA ribosyltransferase-isomerase